MKINMKPKAETKKSLLVDLNRYTVQKDPRIPVVVHVDLGFFLPLRLILYCRQ